MHPRHISNVYSLSCRRAVLRSLRHPIGVPLWQTIGFECLRIGRTRAFTPSNFETMKEFVLWLGTMGYDLVDLLIDLRRFGRECDALEDELRGRRILADIAGN
jgi:hypothetical protein